MSLPAASATATRSSLDSRLATALTFDDVLLVPRYAAVHPRDVSTRTRFSRHIVLNIPIVSAAMDTVTESALAIALAREGGIGVIHKNLSIADQAAQVDRVKRSESGMIVDPVTLSPAATLAEAHSIMARFHISGVPITENGKLVGILTNRDLRFEDDHTKRVADEEWKTLGHTPPSLSPAAGQDLNTIWKEVRKLQSNAALVPEQIRTPLNTFLDRIESARQSRLSFATYSLPEIFWTLIILFFIAAAIMDARHPHRKFGVAMIASHMAVTGVVIALVMIVDNPFSGQASIDPAIIRNALNR